MDTESCRSTESLIKDFHETILSIGNHQEYGLFKETYEDRFNELLVDSNKMLELELSLEKRVEIMCWQFWIVGNMSGQKLKVKNKITSVLKNRELVPPIASSVGNVGETRKTQKSWWLWW